MKRIFVATGSTATKSLIVLIERLRSENIFDKYQDIFIALDTDQSCLQRIRKFDQNCARIIAWDLEINSSDHAVLNIQKSWTAQIIPPGGVGGDRTISGKPLGWRAQWDAVDVQPDDVIVLIGSAFGGTSTGLYLNVAQYIDLCLTKRQKINGQYAGVVVLGFLILPEAVPAPGYPVAFNMCDFWRDMQTMQWQRRLESLCPGFKVPVWAREEHGCFALHDGVGANTHGVKNSYLPFSRTIILPTPPNEAFRMPELAGEILLSSLYVGVFDAAQCNASAVDTFSMDASGNPGPRHNLTTEERAFNGFNMLVLKSGRMRSLKNWFYSDVPKGLAGLERPVEVTGIRENVFEMLKRQHLGATDLGMIEDPVLKGLQRAISNMTEFERFVNRLPEVLEHASKAARNIHFELPAFDSFMLTLSSQPWTKELTFGAIKDAYRDFDSHVRGEAAKVRETAVTLERKGKLALEMCRKRMLSFPARVLDQSEPLFRELASDYADYFRAKFKGLLFQARCSGTIFVSEDAFNKELETYRGKCKAIVQLAEQEITALAQNRNPYVIEGRIIKLALPEGRGIPDYDPVRVVMASAILGEVHLVATAKASMEALSSILEKIPPSGNPLREATYAPVSHGQTADQKGSLKTYSPLLSVTDSGKNHYHFALRNGQEPPGFSLTNGDVHQLGLGTFPNLSPPGSPFFGMPHNSTRDSNSWNDRQTMLQQGNNPGTTPVLDGVWLGTIGMDFEAAKLLFRIYDATGMIPQWQNIGVENSGNPRRLMTLLEMLYFGTLLQVLEMRVAAEWKTKSPGAMLQQHRLQVDFDNGRLQYSLPVDANLTTSSLLTRGFIPSGDGCKMVRITPDWVKAICEWFHCGEFEIFYQLRNKFATVRQADTNILSDIRFRLTNEELDDLERLRRQIADTMKITIF